MPGPEPEVMASKIGHTHSVFIAWTTVCIQPRAYRVAQYTLDAACYRSKYNIVHCKNSGAAVHFGTNFSCQNTPFLLFFYIGNNSQDLYRSNELQVIGDDRMIIIALANYNLKHHKHTVQSEDKHPHSTD